MKKEVNYQQQLENLTNLATKIVKKIEMNEYGNYKDVNYLIDSYRRLSDSLLSEFHYELPIRGEHTEEAIDYRNNVGEKYNLTLKSLRDNNSLFEKSILDIENQILPELIMTESKGNLVSSISRTLKELKACIRSVNYQKDFVKI